MNGSILDQSRFSGNLSGLHEKERVAREIESTDKAIDRLVYELSHKGMLYGLTEDEIKIIEEQ